MLYIALPCLTFCSRWHTPTLVTQHVSISSWQHVQCYEVAACADQGSSKLMLRKQGSLELISQRLLLDLKACQLLHSGLSSKQGCNRLTSMSPSTLAMLVLQISRFFSSSSCGGKQTQNHSANSAALCHSFV